MAPARTPGTDGRAARAERSRTTIADAALELLREGDLRPTAGRVAERAGLSERLIYHHFHDLESLWQAVAERQVAQLRERAPDPVTTGPLDQRIDAVVAARADQHEWVTPVRRASLVREPFSTTLAANRARLNEVARREVADVFATELGALDTDDADDLLAALDAALSWPVWDQLRAGGASPERARRAVHRTVSALLR